MADLGTAYVQIVPEATGISGKITKAISPEATSAGTTAGKKIATSMGSKLQSLGGGFMKAGAIATAVSVPIVAGIQKAMSAYQVQSAAETKLTEIYKTRMGASKKAAQSTMELASAIQKEGVVGDEVTLSGAQQLATFAKYPKTVNSLLPAMNNLLVQQKGLNGTTQDATQIANLMGKVMMGQTGALKRVGVSFTESEEKVLKYGNEQEKAAMLSKVITNNVGNMNKVMAQTPEGKIQQMNNSLGDLVEEIGAALAPALAEVANWISANIIPKVEAFISFLQGNPIIGKIVVGIAGLLAIGGPLLMIIGAIMSAVGGFIPVIAGLSAPILGIIGVIGAVVAALVYAWNTSETFRNAVINMGKSIWAAVQPLIPLVVNGVKSILGILGNLIQSIAASLVPAIKAVTPIITGIIKVIIQVAKSAIPILIKGFQLAANIIKGAVNIISKVVVAVAGVIRTTWNVIKSVTTTVWNGIKGAITKPVQTAKGLIETAIKAIKGFLKFTGLGSAVKTVFNTVKSAITSPIDTAKDLIGKIIAKIKGMFNFKISFPKVPLPHFSISPAGWKVGDLLKGKIPTLGIKWYAKGGIFDKPTLLSGLGEAGPEAAVPLSGKRKMRPFANAIAEAMGGATTSYVIGDVTLDVSSLKDVATIEDIFTIIKRAKGLARG